MAGLGIFEESFTLIIKTVKPDFGWTPNGVCMTNFLHGSVFLGFVGGLIIALAIDNAFNFKSVHKFFERRKVSENIRFIVFILAMLVPLVISQIVSANEHQRGQELKDELVMTLEDSSIVLPQELALKLPAGSIGAWKNYIATEAEFSAASISSCAVLRKQFESWFSIIAFQISLMCFLLFKFGLLLKKQYMPNG